MVDPAAGQWGPPAGVAPGAVNWICDPATGMLWVPNVADRATVVQQGAQIGMWLALDRVTA